MKRTILGLGVVVAAAGGLLAWQSTRGRSNTTKLDKSAVSELTRLQASANDGFTSMSAAIAIDGSEEEHAALDAKAAVDYDALKNLFDTMRPALPSQATRVGQELIDIFETAQVQVMSFAINRKNRGASDSRHEKMEVEDRETFKRNAHAKIEELAQVLKTKRVATI